MDHHYVSPASSFFGISSAFILAVAHRFANSFLPYTRAAPFTLLGSLLSSLIMNTPSFRTLPMGRIVESFLPLSYAYHELFFMFIARTYARTTAHSLFGLYIPPSRMGLTLLPMTLISCSTCFHFGVNDMTNRNNDY